MKIKPSLRLYFLVSILIMGTVTILSFSALTGKYFIEGMDNALKIDMIDAAEMPGVEPGHPVQYLTLNIASEWEDVPEPVSANFELDKIQFAELNDYIEFEGVLSPPKTGHFVMKVRNTSGEIRYLSKSFDESDAEKFEVNGPPHLIRIFVYAASGIGLFSLVFFIILRKVAKPVVALKDWAKSLDENKVKLPAPDFHYSELNDLADIVKSSLSSVQQSLDREQAFLGHASHELRTPISVVRTNSELLAKLVEKNASPERQQQALERIQRASLTMTDLTETLLWLNRQDNSTLPATQIELGDLISQLFEDLQYLIVGKRVELSIQVDQQRILLPETLCRIVLTNLIRNAFQHTNGGKVEIVQTGGEFLIRNINDGEGNSEQALGFGLGLQLTERLIKQYHWRYSNQEIVGGREVFLNFNVKDKSDQNCDQS